MPRDVLLGLAPCSVERRALFQEAAKFCTAELFREFGGAQRVGEYFQHSAVRAYNLASRNNSEQLSVWRALALTSAKATAMARTFALHAGGVFCPLATAADSPAMIAAAASVREHGEAIAKTIDVLADGKVTPRELTAAVREIDEAMAALASLRGALVVMAEGEK